MLSDVRIKSIIALIFLGVIDAVIPLPVIGIILIFIIFMRPPWFRDMVMKIYDQTGRD